MPKACVVTGCSFINSKGYSLLAALHESPCLACKMDTNWNGPTATNISDINIIEPNCLVTILWQQTNFLYVYMATYALATHSIV